MVAIYIFGRLGNQLFQYAFSKAIKLAQGDHAPFVFNFDLVHKNGTPEDGFEDALKYFNVESYKTDSLLWFKYGTLKQIFLYLLFKIDRRLGFTFKSVDSWYILFRNHGLIYVRFSGGFSQINYPVYQKYLKTGRPKKIVCKGCFEVPALFEHIKPILIEEFTPKQPPRPENRVLYDIINSTNSICVSIRRGDFLSERFKPRFLVCDQDYFDRALEKAKELVENPVFIFFSDDIEWVKENVKTEVVSNNVNPRYNYDYNGIKIYNSTKYKLTNEMLDISNFSVNKDKILIYHTHTCESYTPTEKYNYQQTGNFRTTDLNFSVARVGEELKKQLESYNIKVVQNKTYHDYPSYNGSYSRSLTTANNMLNENKDADIVIDLHRDAITDSSYAPKVKIGDEYVSQMMFVIGTDIANSANSHWNENLKFAVKVQQKANEMYPRTI